MKAKKNLNQKKLRRKIRVRAKIRGTAQRPRLSVFRSNRYTRIQLIDDLSGRTLVSLSTRELKTKSKETKVSQSQRLGNLIAEKALSIGIKEVVLDRGAYQYHGRITALAEAARKSGLKI